MASRRTTFSPEEVDRAVRLSQLPGLSMAQVSRRTGIPVAAIRRSRQERPVRLDRDDLLLAALTRNGERSQGAVGDLAVLASWLDYTNKDGTTAAEVTLDLERLAAEGRIVLRAGRFRLVGRWP